MIHLSLSKAKKGEDKHYTSKKFQKHNHILLSCFSACVDALFPSDLHINVQIIWIELLLVMIFSAAC